MTVSLCSPLSVRTAGRGLCVCVCVCVSVCLYVYVAVRCEELGQQLAVVSSQSDFLAVLEAVSGLTSTFSAWIGGRQLPDAGSEWLYLHPIPRGRVEQRGLVCVVWAGWKQMRSRGSHGAGLNATYTLFSCV